MEEKNTPVNHGNDVCGMHDCCYKDGDCENNCDQGLKEFIRMCEADKRMREIERNAENKSRKKEK